MKKNMSRPYKRRHEPDKIPQSAVMCESVLKNDNDVIEAGIGNCRIKVLLFRTVPK